MSAGALPPLDATTPERNTTRSRQIRVRFIVSSPSVLGCTDPRQRCRRQRHAPDDRSTDKVDLHRVPHSCFGLCLSICPTFTGHATTLTVAMPGQSLVNVPGVRPRTCLGSGLCFSPVRGERPCGQASAVLVMRHRTQNIELGFADSFGTLCSTSQCSTTLPLSSRRKMSMPAQSASPGQVWWQCRTT